MRSVSQQSRAIHETLHALLGVCKTLGRGGGSGSTGGRQEVDQARKVWSRVQGAGCRVLVEGAGSRVQGAG